MSVPADEGTGRLSLCTSAAIPAQADLDSVPKWKRALYAPTPGAQKGFAVVTHSHPLYFRTTPTESFYVLLLSPLM